MDFKFYLKGKGIVMALRLVSTTLLRAGIVGFTMSEVGYRGRCFSDNNTNFSSEISKNFNKAIFTQASDNQKTLDGATSISFIKEEGRQEGLGVIAAATSAIAESTISTSLDKVRLSSEVQNFKKRWRQSSHEMKLDLDLEQLQILIDKHGSFVNIKHGKLFREDMFTNMLSSLYMPGIAVIASHLIEKKGLKGLFVCATNAALLRKVQELVASPEDQRCAFITSEILDEFNYTDGHKITICLEKKDSKLSIVYLDSMSATKINSSKILFEVLKVCKEFDCVPDIFSTSIQRQRSVGGCFVFALQDAVSFLQDAEFLKSIDSEGMEIHDGYRSKSITTLPPGCLIGTQSIKRLEECKKKDSTIFTRPIAGRKKTLEEYLQRNVISDNSGVMNYYIAKKRRQYKHFIVAVLKELTTEEIKELIFSTLLF